LIEIRKDIQGDAEISDEKFSKWGRSFVMEGKPFAKKALDNFVAAPLEEIVNKLGADSVISKVKEFLPENLSKLFDEAVAWLKKMSTILLKIKSA